MGWLSDAWDTLTGQKQENERTAQTNATNERSIKNTNETNLQIARETNEQNYDVAMQNLGFQKDMQEYNKALQQQIFEREDTSYQRTAQDMLAAGLNPLSMQGTNGAGEAIAMDSLNNNYNAQQPSPMQPFQAIKANAMMSPLQAAGTILSSVNSVISGIESVKNGVAQRDSLQNQIDLRNLDFFLNNMDKGLIYNVDNGKLDLDNEVFNKYLETKAKQKDYDIAKMNADMREWKHMEDAGKYQSDSKYEQILTAFEDWFVNGRGFDMWQKLCNKYPILKLFTPQAANYALSYQDMTPEEKQKWSNEVNDSVKKAVETNSVLKSSSNSKSQYR